MLNQIHNNKRNNRFSIYFKGLVFTKKRIIWLLFPFKLTKKIKFFFNAFVFFLENSIIFNVKQLH